MALVIKTCLNGAFLQSHPTDRSFKVLTKREKRHHRRHAAAAAAKSLQSCPTLCNPIDGNPSGSPVLVGFSRQEHWSGLPFPSPMHESEK